MPRKPTLLNVRRHLKHIELIFDGIERYGLAPLVLDEIVKARLINRAILKHNDEARTRGDRKDIRVPAQS